MQFDSNISNSRAMIWMKLLLHFGNKSLQDVRMIYEKGSVGVLRQFYSRFIRDDNFLKNCWKVRAFECCLSVCSSFFSKRCQFTLLWWQLYCQTTLIWVFYNFHVFLLFFFLNLNQNIIKNHHYLTTYPIHLHSCSKIYSQPKINPKFWPQLKAESSKHFDQQDFIIRPQILSIKFSSQTPPWELW